MIKGRKKLLNHILRNFKPRNNISNGNNRNLIEMMEILSKKFDKKVKYSFC